MTARIIDGKKIAGTIRDEIREKISKSVSKGHRPPCLAVILVGNDAASKVYVGHKKRACAACGLESRSFELAEDTSQEKLLGLLEKLNNDADIDGILLQLPLPRHLDAERAIDRISPEKDVDGLTPYSQGLLVWRRPKMVSCTPAGVMELLHRSDITLLGKNAVVIGRSVLVGAPMATLLANAGASVQSLHSKSVHPKELTAKADIVVVAAGVHHLVKEDWIKPGAVVIDVGIHNIDGKLQGDVDFARVKEKAAAISPVPGGVGPMTIAMLLKNCVTAFEQRLGIDL